MIYCVEDDSSIRELILYTLRASGFEAQGFDSGEALFSALAQCKPRLILLDIMLPGMDGTEILKTLRAASGTGHIPVILATAKSTEFDKVNGLDLGADDYLTKPFGMMEMVARVRAVLRRAAPREQNTKLVVPPMEMDVSAHTLNVDGVPVELTLKEFELLRLFMENPGRVYAREQLLERIWGMEYYGETRTVDVHIGTLRTKLGACGEHIRTVRGVGYRLEKPL